MMLLLQLHLLWWRWSHIRMILLLLLLLVHIIIWRKLLLLGCQQIVVSSSTINILSSTSSPSIITHDTTPLGMYTLCISSITSNTTSTGSSSSPIIIIVAAACYTSTASTITICFKFFLCTIGTVADTGIVAFITTIGHLLSNNSIKRPSCSRHTPSIQ